MRNVQKRNWARAISTMLAVLLVCVLTVNHARSQQLQAAENHIRAVYEKAFYEACGLTEAIASDYRKLTVASGGAQQLTLLGGIASQAQTASGSLALLPLDRQSLSDALKIVNQAADYAAVLGEKIASGETISESDYAAMLTLADRASLFSQELALLLAGYEDGQAVFSAAGDSLADTGEARSPLTGTTPDSPALLYDGPYADNQSTGNYAMLSGLAEITPEQARQRLADFIGADEIAYLGETAPEIPVYEFQMQKGAYRISAGVTKQGGHILYLLPETQGLAEVMPQEELYSIAGAFLRDRGYGDMHMSYASRYGGVLTINYAAVQDGVILYPDLVKIQLSMQDGSVIGLDARAYLKNHALREIAQPALAPEDAAAAIGPKLSAQSARLCVIPKNGAEYLCYEVSATDGESAFLAYIDAQTGMERDLMQLVETGMGTQVM